MTYDQQRALLRQAVADIEEHTGFWLDESELTPEVQASCESLAQCIHQRLGP